jgi:primosomal protein N' (replication factor Y)
MVQVSGRSGRKKKRGTVIIQTYNPQHPIIKAVVKNDYTGMYNGQIAERRKFKYPPFYRLILLKVKHRDPEMVNKAAALLASDLRKTFGNNVLGPEYPPVARIMNKYLKHIMIKAGVESSIVSAKAKLMLVMAEFYRIKEFHMVNVLIDVDPQ